MPLADSVGTSIHQSVLQLSNASRPLPYSTGDEGKSQDQSDVRELNDAVKTAEKQQLGLADLPMEILERIFELLPRGNLACESGFHSLQTATLGLGM